MANIFEINRPNNKITLGTTNTTINIASHTASRLLALDAGKNLEVKAIGTDVQAFGAILDDLNMLGANSADSEFLVGTGAGALAWESGVTARTSIGLGTGDSPSFASLLLTSIKSGATQAGAGAAANELWKTSSHVTLPDNVIMIGV
jgi:hypothetical protein